ncbi:hypothetical protein [Klebsiella pneumoniae]|uniref:hypothetical protein n=1 Tax=Klebsiella pneumoniae TaxID=573 RepID=UPI00296E3678|nr:hypothetical protein [Klebsiella pneumoniae]
MVDEQALYEALKSGHSPEPQLTFFSRNLALRTLYLPREFCANISYCWIYGWRN